MKSVIITGAFGGMGFEATKLFKEMGYTVFAMDKKVGELDGVYSIEADVSCEESLNKAFEKISSITNGVDLIVHYAGIYALDSLVEMSANDFKRVFEINLFGVYLVNKTFLPLIKKGGKIIITTSELAPLDPLPFTGIYAISKGALDKYAYSLKMELQLLDISVSVLRLGAVKTNMLGASTTALDRFIDNTKLYSCNAKRFRDIVNKVEAKNVPPIKVAKKTYKIALKKSPAFAYSLNRNFLLLLLNALPKRLQLYIIKKILK